MNWTEKKNQRRCELIDKEIDGFLSIAESLELDQLQNEMEKYRKKKAPLPIEAVRRTKKELERLVEQNPPPQKWYDEDWLPFEPGDFKGK